MTTQKTIRILLVEDNEINQLVMQDLLTRQGYALNVENNGENAILALQKDRYDLVIMDCMMPVMDGFTTTRSIRCGEAANIDPDIPILALTGLSAPDDREKCLQAGMDAYISKPIKADELYACITALLGRQEEASVAARVEKFSAIIDSMLDVLARDTEQWQIQLQTFCKAGAYNDLAALAHKIRGTADLVGDHLLSNHAAQLEANCRGNDTGRVTELVSKVLSALRQMIDGMKTRSGTASQNARRSR